MEVEKIINKYVEVEKMVEVVDEHKQKELEKIIEDRDSQIRRMEQEIDLLKKQIAQIPEKEYR